LTQSIYFTVRPQETRDWGGGGRVFLVVRITHAKCDYTRQAWIPSNGKGREGHIRPGVALFKDPHHKLRRLLPSAWNDSQICGLLKRYYRRLNSTILTELFEMLNFTP
jgi:hypothetical protein